MIERTEPWLTEAANEKLKSIINNGKNLHVFEYGSGASTIWFCKQPNVERIYSVEHDKKWLKELAQHLTPELAKKAVFFMGETPYHYAICWATENIKIESEVKLSTGTRLRIACSQKPEGIFDIILVDGRNRVKCIKVCMDYVKPGGILILDNSERHYYKPGIDLLKDWHRFDTYQPLPDKYGFTYPHWQTTFFTKPC